MTSEKLDAKGLVKITEEEILKLFGVLTLMSRISFSSRRSLWSSQVMSKYLPTQSIGSVMISKSFQDIVDCNAFIHVSDTVRSNNQNDRRSLAMHFWMQSTSSAWLPFLHQRQSVWMKACFVGTGLDYTTRHWNLPITLHLIATQKLVQSQNRLLRSQRNYASFGDRHVSRRRQV